MRVFIYINIKYVYTLYTHTSPCILQSTLRIILNDPHIYIEILSSKIIIIILNWFKLTHSHLSLKYSSLNIVIINIGI